MKRHLVLFLGSCLFAVGLVSCADQPEQKPAGPTTDTSRIAWSTQNQAPGQGMGQFGIMPQNQYRR